jgi:hypothetical protein
MQNLPPSSIFCFPYRYFINSAGYPYILNPLVLVWLKILLYVLLVQRGAGGFFYQSIGLDGLLKFTLLFFTVRTTPILVDVGIERHNVAPIGKRE